MPSRDSSPVGPEVLAAPAHQALAREAAAKAVVLLQNEPVDGRAVLPIDPASRRVAVLGRLADERNLGDGGFERRLRALRRHRARRAPGRAPRRRGRPRRRRRPGGGRRLGRRRRRGVVVVGYTRADEGEFIGDSGTTHLRSLLPGPDEPDVVAAFEARLAERSGCAIEGSVPGSDALGFSTGGDRERLTLHDADEAADRERRRRQPADRRLPRGGQRRADRGVASPRPRPRPDLVLGDAGRARHRRRPDRRRRRDGTPALHGRRRRRPPPAVRPRRRRGRLRRLARLLAPRPRSARAGLPVRLRPLVHVMAAGPDHARR